jgi:hypothetical protein
MTGHAKRSKLGDLNQPFLNLYLVGKVEMTAIDVVEDTCIGLNFVTKKYLVRDFLDLDLTMASRKVRRDNNMIEIFVLASVADFSWKVGQPTKDNRKD